MTTQGEENARLRSSRYPRHNLQKAEEFARHVFDIGPRNCDVDRVAQAAGYKSSQNGAFAALRASTAAFGFIRSQGGMLSVSDNWIEAFHEENDRLLARERQRAVIQPTLYTQLFNSFSGRQLPSVEKLARTLQIDPNYGILKDAAMQAAEVFMESVTYAKLVDLKGYLINPAESAGVDDRPQEDDQSTLEIVPSHSQPQVARADNSLSLQSFNANELDRIEIKLRSGLRAYLFVPVPLSKDDKERIKGHIDLLLEPGDE
jgi:hypothetical protein